MATGWRPGPAPSSRRRGGRYSAAMLVRPATSAETPQVLEIINREIREGLAHFGTTEHTRTELDGWLREGPSLPYLVAAEGETVLGYARAARWKPREAYDWATEIGVYIRRDRQGRGVGRALYGRLFPDLVRIGYRAIIAGIALPNPPSVRLHEAMGMAHVGTLPRVGYKLGRWLDVGYWVLTVGEGPPRPISAASE